MHVPMMREGKQKQKAKEGEKRETGEKGWGEIMMMHALCQEEGGSVERVNFILRHITDLISDGKRIYGREYEIMS